LFLIALDARVEHRPARRARSPDGHLRFPDLGSSSVPARTPVMCSRASLYPAKPRRSRPGLSHFRKRVALVGVNLPSAQAPHKRAAGTRNFGHKHWLLYFYCRRRRRRRASFGPEFGRHGRVLEINPFIQFISDDVETKKLGIVNFGWFAHVPHPLFDVRA
jgi:hypothetical protein